jgi:hypothetical protein
MIAFARGARTGFLIILMPTLWNTASKAATNLLSRSRMRNLIFWAWFVEVHQQVPGLLGHPCRGRVVGDTEDMDATGPVFDDGQAVRLGGHPRHPGVVGCCR